MSQNRREREELLRTALLLVFVCNLFTFDLTAFFVLFNFFALDGCLLVLQQISKQHK